MAAQFNTTMEELDDQGIFRFLGIAGLLCITFVGGFVVGIWYEAKPPNYEYAVGFQSAQEEKEHKAKLAYRGLAHDVALIYRDRIGEYFIRDGKRCSFEIPAQKKLELAKRDGPR